MLSYFNSKIATSTQGPWTSEHVATFTMFRCIVIQQVYLVQRLHFSRFVLNVDWVELYSTPTPHYCPLTGQQQIMEEGPAFNLRLLTWNIDGLDASGDLEKRTVAVCRLISVRKPHVVFLQEVILQTLDFIRKDLGSDYSIHIPSYRTFGYFTAILVSKKTPKVRLDGEPMTFDFPDSTMGRQLLQLFIKVCDVPIALYTSHMETLKDSSKQRIKQLKQALKFIEEQNTLFHRPCIFGGDLNLRDREVTEAGLPPTVGDVWEVCGKSEVHRYTWDITRNNNLVCGKYSYKPRLRFDRLYLSPIDGKHVRASSFELVGKERVVSCNRFPSDHWGLWAVFQVSNNDVSDQVEQIQKESDLEVTKSLFGVSNSGGIDGINPTTSQQFDELRYALKEKLLPLEVSPYYIGFLDDLLRMLCVRLDVEDLKKLSSTLNHLANKKQRIEKAIEAGKIKKVKASPGAEYDDDDYLFYAHGRRLTFICNY